MKININLIEFNGGIVMKKFDWNVFFIKLTSRKFITLLTTLISSILIAANVPEGSTTQIIAIITAALTALGYMICETAVDIEPEVPEEEKEDEE